MFTRKCLCTVALLAAACLPAARADFDKAALPEKAVVLFQGDSITDGNRGRNADPNHVLGHGYVFVLAAKYAATFPEREVTFYNRGISGDTVSGMYRRLQKDTLDLKPDILSILIGVNDLSRGISVEEYEKQYDALLAAITKALPNVKLILSDPFGLPTGKIKDVWEARRVDLANRAAVVGRLAIKYNAIHVELQKAFDDAVTRAPAETWIWDGVHPTYAGHQVMADALSAAVNAAMKK